MTTETTTAAARSRVGDRPPILSAMSVLGFNYAEIGRMFSIPTMTVSEWGSNKRPIPIMRHIALLFLVSRLTGIVGANYPPQTRYARREEIAMDAARRWCKLARDELDEDTGGVYRAEDLERGAALGQRMLDRLEAQ